jgi:hypothetical protein
MKQFEDGDPCYAPMQNALFAAFMGTAVMDGCEVSATGTSRIVSITAGSVQIGGVEVAVGAGSVTLDVGSSFDRYDLISVNATGSKIVTKGVAKRKCPPQPTGTCLLAIVFVPAGATVIATGNVYDARMLASTFACRYIVATRVRPIPSNVVRWTGTGNVSITIPTIYTPGYVRMELRVQAGYDGDTYTAMSANVAINGVTVLSGGTGSGYDDVKTADVAIAPGDIVTLSVSGVAWWDGTGTLKIMCDDTVPIIWPGSVTWPA